ncbi:MAG: hypothetical protein E7420_03970 [Ruminococcaceae bacterium]|nr:hypothetical protein [Oscillospiraceae bacterium]
MLFQRARDAEIRAENKPSNGPRRAQGKAKAEYSATRRHASVAGNVTAFRKVCGFRPQIKVAPRSNSSLTEMISVGDFLFFPQKREEKL